jgi:hypothetical protein
MSTVPRPNGYGAEKLGDLGVGQLTDLYQQQLSELSACHSLLQTDQERLAEMLAPYVSSDGRLSMNQPDPKVILFKQGLDLRMKEFEDDCRRIQKTERRLQSKIDEATVGFESQFAEASGLADKRVLKRISEQQRIIEAQQIEMDQLRFERDVLKDETRRLQALARREPPNYQQSVFNRGGADDGSGIPDLHGLREGRKQGTDDRIKFPGQRGAGVGRRDGADAI